MKRYRCRYIYIHISVYKYSYIKGGLVRRNAGAIARAGNGGHGPPPDDPQILFSNRLDLYRKPPDSGERQCRSRT